MKLLFVTSMQPSVRFPLRGTAVRRLEGALRVLGHEVVTLPFPEEGGFRRYWRMRPVVRAAIERERPDLVHLHFGYSGLAVPGIDLPIMTSFYGDDLNGTWNGRSITIRSRVGIAISQHVASRSQKCIVPSRTLRDRLWTTGLRRRTVIVQDAVDPILFRPLPQLEARARLGLDPQEQLIIFPHDTSQPTKRLGLAESAVTVLRRTETRARLWVVNGRPADDMPWYYAAADAMIITSALEGGPSSAKEALACGVPVVSVPVGDLDLFAEVPQAAFLVKPEPESLAEALAHALAVGRGSRISLLPDSLTLAHAVGRLEALYREVVEAWSRRA